jgi:dipeptidase D
MALPAELQTLLSKLPEPHAIFQWFLRVTQVPRGSTFTDKIIPALMAWGHEVGGHVELDKGRNVIVRIPATPGFETKPGICIQSHMDMVVQKNDDVEIDFLKDPIRPRLVEDGKWLMATGTSLGADNGIGIAACFAIAQDHSIKHGPLELLITRDEEIGLLGAAELEEGGLKSKYLINVDSEEEAAICVGCAGGFVVDLTLPIRRERVAEYVIRKIKLHGGRGGHSGVDIHEGRCNMIKAAGRILKTVVGHDIRLASVDGGSAHNAIPRDVTIVVAVPKDKLEHFEHDVHKAMHEVKVEFHKIEPGLAILMEEAKCECECACIPMDAASTKKFVDFMNCIHFGVVRMSPDVEGLVETSFAMTIVKTECDCVKFVASGRSSSGSQLNMVYDYIHSLCELSGVHCTPPKNKYPGWMPAMESPMLGVVKQVHKDVFGFDARVYAIHAGLECGLIMGKNPDILAISIGPTIQHPHSPSERMLVDSVPRFYKLLAGVIEKMAM